MVLGEVITEKHLGEIGSDSYLILTDCEAYDRFIYHYKL
jgi:hypothetical protein